MCLIKPYCSVVNRIDDNHRGADHGGILVSLLKGLCQQNWTQPHSLGVSTYCESSDQCRTDHWIARDVLLRCFRNSSGGEAVGTERKVTGNHARGVLWNQDEYRICLAPHVLRCLGFQIQIEALTSARDPVRVVVLAECPKPIERFFRQRHQE